MRNSRVNAACIAAAVLCVVVPSWAESVIGTVPTGPSPRAVAVDTVTNKIYVANYQNNTVTVIDGATDDSATVAVGQNPCAVAVNPVTDKIYVANEIGNTLTVIDGATNDTASVNTGSFPAAVAVNPVTNRIYVANNIAATVTVYDGATNALAGVIPTGYQPCAIAVNTVTNKIYVANYYSANVTVIDGATNDSAKVAVIGYPSAIAVNSITNKIYVSGNGGSGNAITVIDGATNTPTSVTTGSVPMGVAVDAATDMIYVANHGSNDVTVINGANDSTTTVAVASGPIAIAVDAATDKIYVASNSVTSGNITVIDEAAKTTTALSAGNNPLAVAINGSTHLVYVVNNVSSNVTVIGTPVLPGAVTLVAPSDNAANVTAAPTLKWNSAANATGYAVQVSTSASFAATVVNAAAAADTLTVFLNAGAKYYWRVAGTDVNVAGPWAADSFTTTAAAPPAPSLVSPLNGAINVPLNTSLVWNRSGGAVTYHVEYANDAGFMFITDTTEASSAWAIASLTPGAVYYWRVNATNTFGASPWSAADSFTAVPPVPGAPALTTPANGASGVAATVTLAWDTTWWAASYNVQVSIATTFASVNDTVVSAPSRAIGPLAANHTYYWRVQGENVSGAGAWSTAYSFTVSSSGAISGATPAFKASGMGYNGTLAVYSLNGRLVLRTSFSASAIKTDLLKTAQKVPARGAYFYCFIKDDKVMDKGRFFTK